MIKNIRALVVIAAMVLFPVSVFAEDVPMTEEEVCYEEDYAIEAQTEEEVLIVAEEDEFLEEDGLIEDEEVLEAAAEDFDLVKAFPDENFRNFVTNYYNGDPLFISQETSLGISNMGIKDLTGIEYFTDLVYLDCLGNEITSLDVSGLKKIKSIEFSNSPQLKTVDCSGNQLTKLEVHSCPELEELNCSGNQISYIVGSCPKIRKIDCSNNPGLKEIQLGNCMLRDLNMTGCTAVEVLYFINAQLTNLDVSGFASLKNIMCNSSKLKSLDIRGCTALESLYCIDNQLTSLDVSTCTALIQINCSGNQLQTLDVSFCPNLKLENLTIDDTTKVLTVHEHVWDGGKVTKKATTTAEGVKTYTCTLAACGQTKTEVIPVVAGQITISKKPSIQKPSATKSRITVKWKHFMHTSKKAKKIWKKIKKVQIQCATDKGFKNIVKDVKVSRGKTKYTIKGLSKKTTYYVRARYFDGVGYSNWSKVKKIKTKK